MSELNNFENALYVLLKKTGDINMVNQYLTTMYKNYDLGVRPFGNHIYNTSVKATTKIINNSECENTDDLGLTR